MVYPMHCSVRLIDLKQCKRSPASVVNKPKKEIDSIFLRIAGLFYRDISGNNGPTKMVHLSKLAGFHEEISWRVLL